MTSPTKQSIQTAIAPASPCAAEGPAVLGGGQDLGTGGREPETHPEQQWGLGLKGALNLPPQHRDGDAPGLCCWRVPSVQNPAQAPGGVQVKINPLSPLLHRSPSYTVHYRAHTETWVPRKCCFSWQSQQLGWPTAAPRDGGSDPALPAAASRVFSTSVVFLSLPTLRLWLIWQQYLLVTRPSKLVAALH